MTALLNRKSSFLSGPEWILGPWESHPKSQFDKLFDCIAPIPAFLWRCDNLLREAPSIPRRLKAQDLLANCLTGEKSFHRWFEDYETEFKGRPMYEVTSSTLSRENIPFTETYTFADNFTATTLTYFWTGLIALHGCIDAVNAVATDAPAVTAVNTYPPHQAPHVYYPQQRHTPPNAAVQVANAARYSPAAILEGPAAHVCRSLDFALRTTTQPDLLAPPLLVVRAFYHSLLLARAANYHEPGASTSPQLELEWCDRFAERLAAKGQEIVDLVQRRYWTEIASF